MQSANIKPILLLLLYLLRNDVIGQQYPDFNQDYFNPSLYNPATIGAPGYTELNVTYRKQFSGIENAPDVSVVNFQHSTNSSIDYGLIAISDRSILLNKSTIRIGAAYKLFLSEASLVRFGLSIGYGSNVLDLSQQDQNDPVIAGALRQSSFITGQFGFSFQQQNLEVGVSFPQIFRPKVLTENSFQSLNFKSFDGFREFVVRGSYRINVGARSTGLTPFAFYRQNQILPGIVRAGLIGDYKEQVKLGLGYNTNGSWIGYLGVDILGRLVLSYGYELPFGGNAIDQNSYELNLRYRISSKKKNFLTRKSRYKKRPQASNEGKSEEFLPTEEDTSILVDPDAEKLDLTVQNADNTVFPEDSSSRTPDTTEVIKERPNERLLVESPEIEYVVEEGTTKDPNAAAYLERSKFYVVVGAFKQKNNALDYARILNAGGWFVKVGRGLGKSLYYLYTLETLVKEEASELAKELQRKEFGDAWVHSE